MLQKIFVILLSCSVGQAIGQTSTSQYILFFQDGASNNAVDDIAADYNSTVLTYPNFSSNLALFELDLTSLPFAHPGLPGVIIDDISVIVSGGSGAHSTEVEVDGGVLNYDLFLSDPSDGKGEQDQTDYCYDPNALYADLGRYGRKLGFYDTGVNYDIAIDKGFHFSTVNEINGPVDDEHDHGTHIGTLIDRTFYQGNLVNSMGGMHGDIEYYIGNPLDNNGAGTLFEVLFDINEGLNHGTEVINGSFSYSNPIANAATDPLNLLLSSDKARSSLFVFAAGNDGRDVDDLDEFSYYPAAFDLPNIISVASINCNDRLSSFSNFGSRSVDIAAPGENIRSLDSNGDFIEMSGTSQATGIVSAAALILGSHLSQFDPHLIKCAILNGGDFKPALKGKISSEKALNISGSLAIISSCSNGNSNPVGSHGGNQGFSTKEGSQVEITPNPFTEKIKVNVRAKRFQKGSISIYSIDGSKLSYSEIELAQGTNEILVNFSLIEKRNFYFLKITSEEHSEVKKISRM